MAQIKATAVKNAIAPIDLTPTGRVPAIVAQAATAEPVDQPAGACPRYRDCVETGPHDHHFNHNMRVHSDGGDLLLDAGMAAYEGDDDRPVVYLRGEDFGDAASVHAATARLRQLLDEVDRMAARVFTDHERG
ncbi:hypothetical protein N4P33_15775 [Streptomyces sp. 15-116A]|uniref:hypothetical protein n=1 Tax=Streptomyces sp. 15-116A TaxID=2259035 RepID=UPI0021B46FF9|nr:hypothetical protein [Streptomyces sp. 15-116A]MCT7353621.1 hypothetical protein [Streptomyces sp. 15-116A]